MTLKEVKNELKKCLNKFCIINFISNIKVIVFYIEDYTKYRNYCKYNSVISNVLLESEKDGLNKHFYIITSKYYKTKIGAYIFGIIKYYIFLYFINGDKTYSKKQEEKETINVY